MLTALYDCRGVPDLTKKADLYIVASTHTARPALGNPKGRVLASVQATIHFDPDGLPVGDSYNLALTQIAGRFNAVIPGILGIEPNGYSTRGIDLTKRGVAGAVLNLWLQNFGWADGLHWDVCTPLSDPTEPWDSAMTGMANGVRESGKLLVCQQFHLTQPVMASNGPWLEQSPTSFGYTMERHTADLKAFREQTARVDGHDGTPREVVWVCELRWPYVLPSWYVDQVKAWCLANGIYLSMGYDQSAVGAP